MGGHLTSTGHKNGGMTGSYAHISPVGKKRYKCDHCDYSTADFSAFIKHLACISHQHKINTGCHRYTYENEYGRLCWEKKEIWANGIRWR